MRLLEILMIQRKFKMDNPESLIHQDDQLHIKFYLDKDLSFISLFKPNGGEYICSLEMRSGIIFWNTFKSITADIEIEESDIVEDESYLTMKYGRYFGKDILDKINIPIRESDIGCL